MNIYESGAGDALINPTTHPHAIREYLDAERAFILKCLPAYNVLVEGGCTTGRYAADAIDNGKEYIGIDRVARYLLEGSELHPGATFVAADITHLAGILPRHLVSADTPLIVVPFNLIGTLAAPRLFLDELLAAGYDFLIFSFNTDDDASTARTEYYRTSGFDDLAHHEKSDGVLFTSLTGLHSFAYSRQWFGDAFSQADARMHETPIGKIGTAFSNF